MFLLVSDMGFLLDQNTVLGLAAVSGTVANAAAATRILISFLIRHKFQTRVIALIRTERWDCPRECQATMASRCWDGRALAIGNPHHLADQVDFFRGDDMRRAGLDELRLLLRGARQCDGRVTRLDDAVADAVARTCTLPPSSRSTGGLSTTWLPCLTPSLTSTSVPRSRISVILRLCAIPSSTTST